QGTREAMLEAAGGVGGLVLEVELDAREALERQPQQVGIGRARGLLAEQVEGFAGPVALGEGVPGGGRRKGSAHGHTGYATRRLSRRGQLKTPYRYPSEIGRASRRE